MDNQSSHFPPTSARPVMPDDSVTTEDSVVVTGDLDLPPLDPTTTDLPDEPGNIPPTIVT